jgi:integrase/recombinase XerD
MSGLQAHVDDYLRLRRALGFKLKEDERLLGLLVVSGMRIGEAVALEREDVDLDAGLVTIHKAKHDRARLVPLHPTAAQALRGYASERDRLCPAPRSRAFFLSSAGTPVLANGLRQTFREITTRIGIRTQEVHPRIHDLRHHFAVQTLIDWQRSGVNIDEHIPTLSTYLGHVSPADTYWYLSASPELMALAADRVHDRFGGER